MDAAEALLQAQLPLERLDVHDDGLGLHGEEPAGSADRRVPGPEVALDRERNLGPPAEAACTRFLARPSPRRSRNGGLSTVRYVACPDTRKSSN
jgi:hypothetical protein